MKYPPIRSPTQSRGLRQGRNGIGSQFLSNQPNIGQSDAERQNRVRFRARASAASDPHGSQYAGKPLWGLGFVVGSDAERRGWHSVSNVKTPLVTVDERQVAADERRPLTALLRRLRR